MKMITNAPLLIAFTILLSVFLLFCGGAITMTMMNNNMNNNGLMSNVSWIWVPTIVALFLSILLGWALFWKKE